MLAWAGVAITAGMDVFFTYIIFFNRYFHSVLCARYRVGDSDQTHAEVWHCCGSDSVVKRLNVNVKFSEGSDVNRTLTSELYIVRLRKTSKRPVLNVYFEEDIVLMW